MGKADMGKCLKNCTPSATQMCTQPQFVMDPILQDAVPQSTSLYCFSVYTQDSGSTQINYELDVLKEQHARNIGIFHLAKRKISGTWVNTGMFTQIWKKITKHV